MLSRWFSARTLLVIAGISFGFLGALEPSVLAEGEESGDQRLHDLYYGVHLPDDRRQSRSLDLARDLLDEQRYSEAIPLLLEIAQRQQDRAYGVRSENRQKFESLKTKTHETLAQLDEVGWQSYLIASEASARRELRESLSSGDYEALGNVARKYPQTASSAAACWALATRAADEGNHERALAWLRKLRTNARYGSSFEPQASLAAEHSLMALNKLEAAQVEHEKSRLSPDLLAKRETGLVAQKKAVADDYWAGLGGDRRRTRRVAEGTPHLWARWQTRTAVNVNQADRFEALSLARRRDSRPVVPVADPLAMEDVVVARLSDRVVAVDWQTGRRVWQTRPVDLAREQEVELRQVMQRLENSNDAVGVTSVGLWLDQVNSSLSTDGELVFALHANSQGAGRSNNPLHAPFGRNRRRLKEAQPTTNRLEAYDPRLEGKLVWTADGSKSGEAWQGSFFLGAPLAIDGRLLAIIERDQTLFLVEIEPTKGGVLWRQPLVTLEATITDSPIRRLVGCGLAAVDEVAICSTGSGAVVAVDLVERTLKWVCRLPTESGRRPRPGPVWGRRREQLAVEDARRRWLENEAAIIDGKVIVASPESNQLHCLDLATGERLWSHSRGDGLLISAVSPEHAYVLSPHSVSAVSLADGRKAWRLPLPGKATVVGRGLLVGDELLTPLEDGSLCAIDVTKKRVTKLLVWDGDCGNLIYHRGALVSQSLASVSRFDQLPGMLQRVEETLAQSPADLGALVAQGEAALSRGDVAQALEVLQRAYGDASHSSLVGDRLRRTLLETIQTSPPNEEDLGLLWRLAQTDQQRLEVVAASARIAAAKGNQKGVEASLVAASELDWRDERLVPVAAGYRAKPSRVLAGAASDVSSAARDASSGVAFDSLTSTTLSERQTHSSLVKSAQLLEFSTAASRLREPLIARWEEQGEQARAELERAKLPESFPGASQLNPTAWTYRQAVATTTPRRGGPSSHRYGSRSGRASSYVLLPVSHQAGSEEVRYGVSLSGQQIVCWDGHGSRRFEVDVPKIGADLVRRLRASKPPKSVAEKREFYAWQVGGELILSAGGDVVGIDTLATQRGEEPQVWSAQRCLRDASERRRGESGFHTRTDMALPTRLAAVGASPYGVLVRGLGMLACLDPLSGDPCWIRSDLRLDKAEVAVDGQTAYVNEPRCTAQLRLVDGHFDDQWQGPSGNWLEVRSGLITTLSTERERRRVAVCNADSGELLIEKAVTADAKLARVDHAPELLIAEPSLGAVRLTVLNMTTGSVTLDTAIEGDNELKLLAAQRRPFGLLVALSGAVSQDMRSLGVSPLDSGSLLSGSLVCLRPTDGVVAWQAECSAYELVARTPVDCPLVVLGRRDRRQTTSSVKVTSQLLVLDGATGRSVCHLDKLPEDAVASFQLRYDAGPHPVLRAAFPRTISEVRVTDTPLPPGPPYRGDVESPSQVSLADLWGMSKQLGQALGEAIRPKEEDEEEEEE